MKPHESRIVTRGLSRRFGARQALGRLDPELDASQTLGLRVHKVAGTPTAVGILAMLLRPDGGSAGVGVHSLALEPTADGEDVLRATLAQLGGSARDQVTT